MRRPTFLRVYSSDATEKDDEATPINRSDSDDVRNSICSCYRSRSIHLTRTVNGTGHTGNGTGHTRRQAGAHRGPRLAGVGGRPAGVLRVFFRLGEAPSARRELIICPLEPCGAARRRIYKGAGRTACEDRMAPRELRGMFGGWRPCGSGRAPLRKLPSVSPEASSQDKSLQEFIFGSSGPRTTPCASRRGRRTAFGPLDFVVSSSLQVTRTQRPASARAANSPGAAPIAALPWA